MAANQRARVDQWQTWLAQRQLPSLECLDLGLKCRGHPGFALPGLWPPSEGGEHEAACLAYFANRAKDR